MTPTEHDLYDCVNNAYGALKVALKAHDNYDYHVWMQKVRGFCQHAEVLCGIAMERKNPTPIVVCNVPEEVDMHGRV